MVLAAARIVAVALIFLPTAARADWLFTPIVGPTFGADTFGQPRAAYGAALGWRDEEAFGWEIDVSLAPKFFDGVSNGSQVFAGSGRVLTAMANVIVGLGTHDPATARVQPYATGGIGWMQMHVVSDASFSTTTNEAGFNLGGGAMIFPAPMLGLRADLRYVRSFQNQEPSWTRGTELDVAPGSFDFWRATFGVAFRFGQ